MTASSAGLRTRGLTWSVLTTHRAALRVWVALVAIAVTGLVSLYLLGEEVKQGHPCSVGGGDLPPCSELDAILPIYTTWMGAGASAIAWVPLTVAAFAGGALVGRELESGTAAMSWTQSVTPVRWLAARLAVPALLLTTGTVVVTLLFRWVWTSGEASVLKPWYWSAVFRATGPVTTAYVLLALAVGAVAALLTRRVLPALGSAVGVMLLVHVVADHYRPDLWPTTELITMGRPEVTGDFQQFGVGGLVADSGERIDLSVCYQGRPAMNLPECMTENGASSIFVRVHPPSHYWPIQLVETGIALALTALLVIVAFRVLRRRVA